MKQTKCLIFEMPEVLLFIAQIQSGTIVVVL